MSREKRLRPHDHLEDNPIGLARTTVERIVPELDRHVASFFVLFHQYQKHHWLVEGPEFRDLHVYLEESYNEVHADVDAIAERLTTLGGIPTSSPKSQARLAYIEHESEGAFSIRDMLERNRQAEETIASNLRCTIRDCTVEQDFGTETLLKSILLKCENRAHHLDHYLASDSLAIALTEESGA